ncbi:MAG: primosomal protein N' [Planctomycetota bacterium]|nr:MAG: primosomal protein N' [Planctomycetota bacterium]
MAPASLFQTETDPGPLVRVALERSLDAPEGLTYRAPASVGEVRVGDRVEAPLGRHDRRASGWVVEVDVAADISPDRIKPIRRRTGITLPVNLVALARWIAGYYCCPLGVALSAVAPGAVKHARAERPVTLLTRTGKRPTERLPPVTARVWEAAQALPEDAFPIEPRALVQRIGAPSVGPVNRLVRLGLLRKIERVRTPDLFPGSALSRTDRPATPGADRPTLTPEQAAAVEGIGATLGTFSPHLLLGVTGSGKTEVYLRVLERVIQAGGCGIVLVPEIGLTPQTVDRFLARFAGAGVAVLHSGLSMGQRRAHWTRIARGEARVAVGARSAVFAPFDPARGARLGLIIVDEEHDGAYKQEDAPRHHARDVALKRAQMEGCPVVLGSATPSLESWRHARTGRYTLHRLTERVGGARLPRVAIVDLADEMRADPTPTTRLAMLGPTLRGELSRALDAGAQAILLLNRRGWASYITCPDHRCGWTLTCRFCDVTMVHHRTRDLPAGGVVRCHHCLSEQRLPGACPVCGKRVTLFGAGTQRVEDELARLYPELALAGQVMRVDSDTMRSAKDYHRALEAFAAGSVRLLLGTQMLAKGHDFPGVELVGVINADTALNLPDFRAAERTFQLVAQVAGRAGRASRPGRVVVQTFSPGHPAVRLAAAHDYEAFAEQELALRTRASLPPAARMARLVVRHERYERALADARRIAEALERVRRRRPELRVRGPMPCPIARINDRRRIAVELLAPGPGDIQAALTALRNAGLAKNDAATAVDVDPIALL